MMRVLDLFSGIGGFSLGLERTGGFRTVAFCEIDKFCRAVLRKHWPEVPIYDDVRTLTADTLSRDGVHVDLICGGFPCQDASIANVVGRGTDGSRTGLFREVVRLACELGCPLLLENVTELLNRGFGDVLAALAEIGHDAEWHSIRARDGGADHERERLFIFSYPRGSRWEGFVKNDSLLVAAHAAFAQHGYPAFEPWRALVAGEYPLRNGNGLSVAMERRRLHQIGNAIVPQVVEVIGRAILASAQREAA